jgi:hypothetical protein
MSPMSLIARLDQLSHSPLKLAAEIHDRWTRSRCLDGWMHGTADRALKTSPYLKPLSSFAPWEFDREVRLALNDLNGIVVALEERQTEHDLHDPMSAVAASRYLAALRADSAFVESASRVIHAGWRKANRDLSLAAGDTRLLLLFDELSDSDKAITLANVRSDIDAVSRLMAETQA